MIRYLALALCAWIFAGAAGHAAVLNVDGTTGKLLGASGVNVNGTLYDVSFQDGTCNTLFSGCDDKTDFTFQNGPDAEAAAFALLDQVFLDVAAGRFDSDPSLTAGCSNALICIVHTPFDIFGGRPSETDVGLYTAYNFEPSRTDGVFFDTPF